MNNVAKITLLSVSVEKNNHVGQKDDWGYIAIVNSTDLTANIETDIDVSSGKVNFDLRIREKDKVPDIGLSTMSLNYNQIKNSIQKITVNVTENRGPYSGNVADIVFTFSIK